MTYIAEVGMRWSDIIGHAGQISILKNMLAANRVSHALLFTGPEGIGKMLAAKIMAAGLLCLAETGERPCGSCIACREFARASHPDLMLFADDGASLKIDQIRALQNEAAMVPYHGGRRVFVIEQASRLTTQAANSLLKVLEEPPASAVFILTAASPHLLLSTILSRCWHLTFQPLKSDELYQYLLGKGHDSVKASVATRLSGGRLGAAMALLAADGLAARDKALEIAAALPDAGAEYIEETAAALDKLDVAGFGEVLANLAGVLRDVFIMLTGREDLIFNVDIGPKLQAMTPGWNQARLFKALEYVRQAEMALKTNANTRLVCEALLINLSDLVKEGY